MSSLKIEPTKLVYVDPESNVKRTLSDRRAILTRKYLHAMSQLLDDNEKVLCGVKIGCRFGQGADQLHELTIDVKESIKEKFV